MEPLRLSPFWRFIRTVARVIVRGIMRWDVRVTGLEHVPREGGAVVAFNHHSYFDFVMAAYDIVLRLGRPLRFLAKREVWRSPWTGWIVRMGDAVPVDRGSAASRHGAFAAAVSALEAGDLVAIAPEQTISRSFDLLPFRTGAVRMAQLAGVPIVPAAGFGTQRFAAKGQGIHFARRIPVLVRYGEPFHVGPDEDPVAATARLQERFEALLAQVVEEYPDRPTPGDDWWYPARLGGGAPTHEEILADHHRRAERDWGDQPG